MDLVLAQHSQCWTKTRGVREIERERHVSPRSGRLGPRLRLYAILGWHWMARTIQPLLRLGPRLRPLGPAQPDYRAEYDSELHYTKQSLGHTALVGVTTHSEP